jgi:hypothetical protein
MIAFSLEIIFLPRNPARSRHNRNSCQCVRLSTCSCAPESLANCASRRSGDGLPVSRSLPPQQGVHVLKHRAAERHRHGGPQRLRRLRLDVPVERGRAAQRRQPAGATELFEVAAALLRWGLTEVRVFDVETDRPPARPRPCSPLRGPTAFGSSIHLSDRGRRRTHRSPDPPTGAPPRVGPGRAAVRAVGPGRRHAWYARLIIMPASAW